MSGAMSGANEVGGIYYKTRLLSTKKNGSREAGNDFDSGN